MRQLKKCKKCGLLYDIQAPQCMFCGHRETFPWWGYAIIGLLGLVGLAMLLNPPARPPAQAHVKTPAEIREEKINKQFNPWDGSHYGAAKLIQADMHNPDSYKHVETRYRQTDNGNIIINTTYRGTNLFGGVVTNWAVFEFDIDGQLVNILAQGP